VFLADPSPTRYDLHFSLLGFPVRIHPFFWLTALLLGAQSDDLMGLVLWTAAMFISILVHELGHALTGRAFALSPQITLHGFGGITSFRGSGGDEHSLGYWRQIALSLAGPLAGIALVGLILLVGTLTGHQPVWLRGSLAPPLLDFSSLPLSILVNGVMITSFSWSLLNLVPVFPLDGGQIARAVLCLFDAYEGIRRSLIVSVVAAAIMVAVCLLRWNQTWIAILFAYLGYTSYTLLRFYGTRRR